MTFEPNATQKFLSAVKIKVVKDPASRWKDLSSRLARIGAYVQGVLLLVPDFPPRWMSYVAVVFFVLIGAAKLLAEEKNEAQA